MKPSERGAKLCHELVNSMFWLSNPDFVPNDPPTKAARWVLNTLRANPYETTKKALFRDDVIAVNGESVVVKRSEEVDKYMFRRPNNMPLERFYEQVRHQIGAVTSRITIALPTDVAIKHAECLRFVPSLPAVTQTQPWLDFEKYPAFNLDHASKMNLNDTTLGDLENLLIGTEQLLKIYGYHPDISEDSGNVRIGPDGRLVLVDVMPIYSGGGRLIGDSLRDLTDSTERKLVIIRDILQKNENNINPN